MDVTDCTIKIKQLIDNLKATCSSYGLGNGGDEYKIMVQSFLYKFLNDKFLHNVISHHSGLNTTQDIVNYLSDLSKDQNTYDDFMDELGGDNIRIRPEHLLSNLYNHQNDPEFAKLFDDTLNSIAAANSEVFSVRTDQGNPIPLFDRNLVERIIADPGKRDPFARAIINILATEKIDNQGLQRQWRRRLRRILYAPFCR